MKSIESAVVRVLFAAAAVALCVGVAGCEWVSIPGPW